MTNCTALPVIQLCPRHIDCWLRWADVLDAGANRFFGSGLGGFHVTINPDGKYKNFNLAPRSKDKFEAKLIVDLLSANARKTDRGK